METIEPKIHHNSVLFLFGHFKSLGVMRGANKVNLLGAWLPSIPFFSGK